MTITRIVITGGPCAGKTTAMSWIQNAFNQKGYTVLFIPETATSLITGGVAPWTCGTNCDYQKCQMRMQLVKEDLFETAARTVQADRILMVCDRGALDNRAYMNDEEFQSVLESVGKTETELRERYDAVFHLVTSAKGAEEFYSKDNNAARYESVAEACALDDRLMSAWVGHSHFRVIENNVDFEGKMKKLIAEISAFLGEPEPFEIERKFLIEYPDVSWLESVPGCRKVDIVQTYLRGREGEEVRVRRRGADGSFVYFKTTKRRVSDVKRVEVEKRLSEGEYVSLLPDADPAKKPLHKTRYCLIHRGQYFEIDLYPFWKDQAIAEIELCDEDDEIFFPEEIRVIREVTGEEAFKNAALAEL